ncbi:hypothetical protein PRIPAC_77552 [Pristionchus pacificus]|uniref:Solute carrier family 40 member n=1 Tax=Pristionchus pacificus TaxID=54126 RepID=A0A2A6CQ09_PRIPA|nr:hypothetical protein PRIPAC_77552 [Pristionchus pacificus]|eukprot:PDM80178.1 hypothetical protein PRIPAC_32757 [Pristionchus pacificus]
MQNPLYAAYLCTCLENRIWSFAVSLCMHSLGGIQLVSIEQLVEGLAQIAFSGAVGRAIDLQTDRKWGMMMCLFGNNFSMIFSCLLVVMCLSIERSHGIYTISLLFTLALCSAFRIFIVAERNVVGKDWALVLVKDTGEVNRRLARTNATLTSLDQLANVISPLFLSALLSFATLQTTCMILAVYSAGSFILKGVLLIGLYESNESLRTKARHKDKLIQPTPVATVPSKTITSRCSSAFSVLSTYYAQPVYPAALGLALMYMTVLGFNGLDIAYGESTGLPKNVLGFFRSFGSVAGFAGALMYAVFERHCGVRKTGIIGLMLHTSILLLCVVSIWLPGSPWNPGSYLSTLTWSSWVGKFVETFSSAPKSKANKTGVDSPIDWSTMTTSDGSSVASIFTFLIAIAASRFGLWMADLAITHIMQIATPESQRNTVFGVQNAICSTFSIMKDLLVIVLPSPNTFGISILISYAFKCAGCFSYLYYIVKSANTEEDMAKADEKLEEGETLKIDLKELSEPEQSNY